MDYKQAWNELKKYIDKCIKHYSVPDALLGHDVRFSAYSSLKMKIRDIEKLVKEDK